MYDSINIKGFRCFGDLTLNQLARVNVIAGKNCVGKTTLLEALFLHCGATNPRLVLDLPKYRGMSSGYTVPASGRAPWEHLFHDMDKSRPIEITGIDKNNKTRILRLRHVEHGGVRRVDGTQASGESDLGGRLETATPKAWRLELDCVENGNVDTFGLTLAGKEPEVDSHPGAPFPCMFVFARGELPGKDDVVRFGDLVRQQRKDEIVAPMRIVEPRIKDLSIAVEMNHTGVFADLGLDSMLPVEVLGGGVTRILSVTTSIASCKGGVVLIDEAEMGLHHSVHPRVCEAFVQMAIDLDVQLFLTTHSREFVVAALEAGRSLIDERVVRLHRLDRVGDGIEAVTYDNEAMDGAIAADLEVR